MKQRFEYSFEDIDPKLLKLLKKEMGVKKKHKYTLKQAESIISWIQQNWLDETEITVRCLDTDEGASYDFDSISLIPFSMGGNPVELFSVIEDQILQVDDSVLSDPHKLILDINNQYKLEPDVAPINQEKVVKKGFKLPFQLPFGNKKIAQTPQKNEVSDKYYEDYEAEFESSEEDVAQEDKDVASSEPKEAENFDVEEFSEESTNKSETTEEFDFEEEAEQSTSSQFENVPIQNNIKTEYNSNNLTNYPVAEQAYAMRSIKKHETVQLMTLQEYCDLGEEIESSIARTTDKLKPENLFKFIGIPSDKSNRLDERRVNFAMQKLAEVKFENLREHYARQVNSFKGEALDRLRSAIDVAWKKPYDLEVKEAKAEDFEEMEASAQEKIQEFVKRQEELASDKIKKFEAEQEIALQNFVAKQEAEKSVFVADEQERTQNLIESKVENINADLEKRMDEFLDEEMYKLKVETNQKLFDGKRKVKQELAVELTKANEDVWEHALKFITEIQNEINERTPHWATEIKETNLIEQQTYQMQKEQQEMKLKEETLAIKRLEAETNLKRLEELDHENKMLKIKLETALSKNELYEFEREHQPQSVVSGNPQKISSIFGNGRR